MRTLTNLFFRTVLIILIPGQLFAQQLNEKFYDVTDDGDLQFTYWECVEGAKNAIHPVTPRTFFLEAKKSGVIPESMSYQEFLKLTIEELQALITYSQQDIIAAMDQKQEDISIQLSEDMFADAINEQAETELLNYIDQETITEEALTEEQEEDEDTYKSDLPWIIQAMTNPTSNCKVPINEARVPNRSHEKTYDASPWIVQALINQHDLAATDHLINPPAAEESHIRAMVYSLVSGLMAEFNDDRSSDPFGHVFPGIDGKLYGSSDGELTEIVEVLLNMKEEIVVSNNDYVQLFDELEAWASAGENILMVYPKQARNYALVDFVISLPVFRN